MTYYLIEKSLRMMAGEKRQPERTYNAAAPAFAQSALASVCLSAVEDLGFRVFRLAVEEPKTLESVRQALQARFRIPSAQVTRRSSEL